jgi:hypothetical protein
MLATAAATAGAVLVITGGTPGSPARLQTADPATLHVRGPSLRLPSDALGLAWARHGDLLAVVVKPRSTGQPIRLIDLRRMRVTATVPVGDRDVCGLTFTGITLVALASDRPCYWRGGRLSILRIDPRAARLAGVTRVKGIGTVFPTNLAFGDGRAFSARAGGGVDTIDLASGRVTLHRPKRSLAKGEGVVPTRWLGGHLLGVGKLVVDTRTWRARVFDDTAVGVAPAGDRLAVFGPNGVGIYTRSGTLLYRVLADASVRTVHVVGRYLEAGEDGGTDIVDMRTRKETRAAADANFAWELLVP